MRSRADRALALVPTALIAISVLTLYFVEAWLRKTPWVFTDEAEWTQISRAIAATGHAARRGQPIYFKSLYAFLIAPVWWIHSTPAAYAALKYLNATVMSLAAVPTYLLARMFVSRRSAVVVAVLAVLIPGMSYAASIETEVLAYPWYALCSWLIVRALYLRRPLPYALAIGASIAAVLVRSPQFDTVGASFVIAGAGLWVTGARGKAWRANWTRGETFGAIVLLIGGLIVFNRVVLQHIQIWQLSTEYFKRKMIDLGLKAGLAFTVGIGVLPVVGGFASLSLRERRGDPRYRAFAAYLAASILCISLYTAVKAAYLSTVFSTLTEERNLIYLSPLMLVGTAMVFESRRIDWRVVAAASAFVVFLILDKEPNLTFPYFEAPGYAILDLFNRDLRWTVHDLHLLLLGVLGLSLVALAVRRVRAVAAVAAVLVAGWMMTSEIYTTDGTVHYADQFRANLPANLTWVDDADHGRPATYVGDEIVDTNGVLLTEFWNRSIKHVDSLVGADIAPGPTFRPSLVNANGLLSGIDTPYVVGDFGFTLDDKVVESKSTLFGNHLVLYERTGPWRLLDEDQQVYDDSWVPGWSTYTYFKPGQHGDLVIMIGREGYCGNAPPGRATFSVGTVAIREGEPVIKKLLTQRRTLVRDCSSQVVKIPVAQTPVRVVLTFPPGNTFHASPSDPRNLGAQVSFSFVPSPTR